MKEAIKSVAVRSLAIKYVAGLTIIAVLSLASFLSFHDLIEAEQATAAIINISGRQRMLTQKAALLSLRLTSAGHRDKRLLLREEMNLTVLQMKEAHHGLLYGNPGLGLPGNLSPEVQAMFFAPPYNIQETLNSFLREVTDLALVPDSELPAQSYRQGKIATMAAVLVDDLNDVVSRLQAESEARERKMKSMSAVGISVMLVVLMLEYLFIFQPAARTIRREADQLAAANAELMRLSNVDGLTGIANRRLFDDFIVAEWQRAARTQQPLSVIMVDVDHFKLFNDTYGHQAGDECLRRVAAVMSDSIPRATDLVARYGGEEFVVVLANTGISGAAKVAVRLRAAVEGLGIPHAASPVAPVVTVSIGTATIMPEAAGEPQGVITKADQALYQAKRQGRNRVVVEEADHEKNKPKEGKQWTRTDS